MATESSRVLARFIANEYALSVRKTRIAGGTVRGTRDLLIAAGFQHERRPLLAGRTADGAPLWRKLDGSTSLDENEEGVVPVDYYAHHDGGMVRVYPHGDPRERLVPEEEPTAIKSVLFRPPPAPKKDQPGDRPTSGLLGPVVTGFRNEAFRVSDEGLAIPKTRRAIYGLVFERTDPVNSYRIAEVVHLTQVVTRLIRDPEPEGLR